MRATRYALLLAAALTLGGCYHARIETGLAPGGTVIDKPWAMGFIYGLVPPSTVNVAGQCTGGVAVVETQLSFLNQLVSFLTAGIVTPMHITVTCAGASALLQADSPTMTIAEDAKPADVQDAFKDAADLAVATGAPVFVRFE